MRFRPRALNALIAILFMIGSACFALGTIPAYVDGVGGTADAITYFIGSIFFTSASFSQLVQSQSPAMAPDVGGDDRSAAPIILRAWLPGNRGWLAAATQFPGTLAFNVSTAFAISTALTATQAHRLVWAPDFVGSILFLVSSGFAIAAVGRVTDLEPEMYSWQVAWLNMIGSIFFMLSALAGVVLPHATREIDARWASLGTLLGAICFFVGAALMFPEWGQVRRIARREHAVPA
jgi:hypothetical protein